MLTRRALTISALACAGGFARAERAYPSQVISMLVSFPPGTGIDVVGRIVARKVQDILGQPVVVENRSGAFGDLAVQAARRAQPNGYTVVVAGSSFSVNRWTMANATYAVDDFTPIAMLASQPYALMVSQSVPAKTLPELVKMLQADPGKFNAGQGSGTGFFLMSVLNKAMGVNVEAVAYKGTSEAVADLLAGRIQLLFAPVTTMYAYYTSGAAKVLGLSGPTRAVLMPDVPTFSEAGYPSLDISTWFALLGPKGIAQDDVEVLSGAVAKALAMPDVVALLATNSIVPDYQSPADLTGFLKTDMERWQGIVRASGYVPQ
jgi:tripartite-type tricarboxylate transporter receptor subunit TctC